MTEQRDAALSGDTGDGGPVILPEARFEDWYATHHGRIRALAQRIVRNAATAEDIAQETLLRAWLGRERMREADLGAWLSVVARNLSISHVRKERRAVPHEVMPEAIDLDADPASVLVARETRRSVRRALSEIGERHRRVLYMRDIEEAALEQMGADLGLSSVGTRAVLFRARKVLKNRLAAVGEGFGGFLAGVRVRAEDLRRRFGTAAGSFEQSVGPGLTAGMNAILALGLAATGLAVHSRAPATDAFAAGKSAASRADDLAGGPAIATNPSVHTSEAPMASAGGGRGRIVSGGSVIGDETGDIGTEVGVNDPTGSTLVGLFLDREDSPDDSSYTFWTLDTVDASICGAAPAMCSTASEIDWGGVL